jgi:hypothetical protein
MVAGELELVVGARTRDHARAEGSADLHRRQPHAARRGVHEQRFTGDEPSPIAQPQIRGQVRHAERERIREGHPLRDGAHVLDACEHV